MDDKRKMMDGIPRERLMLYLKTEADSTVPYLIFIFYLLSRESRGHGMGMQVECDAAMLTCTHTLAPIVTPFIGRRPADSRALVPARIADPHRHTSVGHIRYLISTEGCRYVEIFISHWCSCSAFGIWT